MVSKERGGFKARFAVALRVFSGIVFSGPVDAVEGSLSLEPIFLFSYWLRIFSLWIPVTLTACLVMISSARTFDFRFATVMAPLQIPSVPRLL